MGSNSWGLELWVRFIQHFLLSYDYKQWKIEVFIGKICDL